MKRSRSPISPATLHRELLHDSAGITNGIGGTVLGFEHGQSHDIVRSFFMAFFVVGLGEELFKFLALMFVAFPRKFQ